MLRSRRLRRPRPLLPHEEIGRDARFAKPHLVQPADDQQPIDTSELPHRKIHPERIPAFLDWLKFQTCCIKDKTDAETGQVHVCWHPVTLGYKRFLSDPMHIGKAYSGRLKRSDKGAIPGCRHAHNLQEDNMDRFDRRFGINRHELAEAYYTRFCAEKGLDA